MKTSGARKNSVIFRLDKAELLSIIYLRLWCCFFADDRI